MEYLKGLRMAPLVEEMTLELLKRIEKMVVWLVQLKDLSQVHLVGILVDLKDVALLYWVERLVLVGPQDLEKLAENLVTLETVVLVLRRVDLEVVIMEHLVVKMVNLMEEDVSYQMLREMEHQFEIVALPDELQVAETLVLC